MMTRCMESERPWPDALLRPRDRRGRARAYLGDARPVLLQSPEALAAVIKDGTPTLVVKEISMSLLGSVGGVLAIISVIVLPISTGDTAFRSARLLVADTLHIGQGPLAKRLMVAIPLFIAGIALTFVDFAVIWRYFGWANQPMSCVTLWSIAVYLARRERLARLPARRIHDRGLRLALSAMPKSGLALSLNCATHHRRCRRRGRDAALPQQGPRYAGNRQRSTADHPVEHTKSPALARLSVWKEDGIRAGPPCRKIRPEKNHKTAPQKDRKDPQRATRPLRRSA
ncbi:MAG: carbon starvation CstA 5TM domain-containing protein [Bilophila sp.]